jgi:hypothetical protein
MLAEDEMCAQREWPCRCRTQVGMNEDIERLSRSNGRNLEDMCMTVDTRAVLNGSKSGPFKNYL